MFQISIHVQDYAYRKLKIQILNKKDIIQNRKTRSNIIFSLEKHTVEKREN